MPLPPTPDPQQCVGRVTREIVDGESVLRLHSSDARYIAITAQAKSIASLGSHSEWAYTQVMNALKNVEEILLRGEIEETIVDDTATRPGRKKSKRAKSPTEK